MSSHDQEHKALAAAVAVMVPLGAIFRALVEKDCAPEWTADGRGIVATCPCCHEPRGLIVTTAAALEVRA